LQPREQLWVPLPPLMVWMRTTRKDSRF